MTKFITEECLKQIYKKQAFSTYELQKNQRLTPGGKQYLSDKSIKIIDVLVLNDDEDDVLLEIPKGTECEFTLKRDYKKEKILCRIKKLEILFFYTAKEILQHDLILAEKIIKLGRNIDNIKNYLNGKCELENIIFEEKVFNGCNKVNQSNFNNDLEECFELSDIYIHAENSDLIFKTYYLLCSLREVSFEISEIYQESDKNIDKVIENNNSIINILSRIVCMTAGGGKCQIER